MKIVLYIFLMRIIMIGIIAVLPANLINEVTTKTKVQEHMYEGRHAHIDRKRERLRNPDRREDRKTDILKDLTNDLKQDYMRGRHMKKERKTYTERHASIKKCKLRSS